MQLVTEILEWLMMRVQENWPATWKDVHIMRHVPHMAWMSNVYSKTVSLSLWFGLVCSLVLFDVGKLKTAITLRVQLIYNKHLISSFAVQLVRKLHSNGSRRLHKVSHQPIPVRQRRRAPVVWLHFIHHHHKMLRNSSNHSRSSIIRYLIPAHRMAMEGVEAAAAALSLPQFIRRAILHCHTGTYKCQSNFSFLFVCVCVGRIACCKYQRKSALIRI